MSPRHAPNLSHTTSSRHFVRLPNPGLAALSKKVSGESTESIGASPTIAKVRQLWATSVESMLWIAGDEAAIESSAALRAVRYLGGIWSALAAIGLLVPAPIRNWAYRLIARNRRRFLSASTSCLVPTTEQPERFLIEILEFPEWEF